jgi:diaminohydroxyphosphoribosylaminopyrimidine deaminase / 5-amino-6-(5-phosphoribosylamino)uracil reductase
MIEDEQWMQRALQLAAYGRGAVSPNPMVGCVIVHQQEIIGEGWHRSYGGPHAEVWAVRDAERRGSGEKLNGATAYVSLEPCSHTGKTPPCAELLVRKQIGRVVICNEDPNPLVAGKGIERLKEAGIEVETGICLQDGLDLNKRFFKHISQKRPYVVLKWAETADGYLGSLEGTPVKISSMGSDRMVHQWRSEEDAILVGYRTALFDNPRLNVRHWSGRNPVRVVIDRNLKLPAGLHLFDQTQATVIVNYALESFEEDSPVRYQNVFGKMYMRIDPDMDELLQLLQGLSRRGIQSVIVEGGAAVLNSFLKTGSWDEIRRCQSVVTLGGGLKAPVPEGRLMRTQKIENDYWSFYQRQ